MIDAIIEEQIYGTKTFVFFDITDEKAKFIDLLIKKHNVFDGVDDIPPIKEIFDNGSIGYTRVLNNCMAIVCFSVKKPKPSIIAHESLHLAYKYLHPKGLHLSIGEEEAYAYFIGFLAGEIHRVINKKNKSVKQKVRVEKI